MHLYVDEALKGAKTSDDIKKAITSAFDRVEKEYYVIAKTAFDGGFPKAAYVGSCALVTVVTNNKVYIANAGDCKAMVLRKKKDSQGYDSVKCSNTHSANTQSEQKRLRAKFKDEKDVVICKSKRACYVKGNLMPTRALGDFRLKH